jgi:TctA family transporter
MAKQGRAGPALCAAIGSFVAGRSVAFLMLIGPPWPALRCSSARRKLRLMVFN